MKMRINHNTKVECQKCAFEKDRKIEMMTRCYSHQKYREQVVEICFDQTCLKKMTPGLKLIFAQTDPPVFVNIEEKESKKEKGLAVY